MPDYFAPLISNLLKIAESLEAFSRDIIFVFGNVIEKKSPNDTFSKIHFFAFSEKGANSAEFDYRIVQLYSH